jgi:uncharacterized protein (DUF983 family)
MFGRALRRHCAICEAGALVHGWFRKQEHCPSCGLRTRRGEDGYTLGALRFNLFLAFDLCFRPLEAKDMT